jgi:hypothetical protein
MKLARNIEIAIDTKDSYQWESTTATTRTDDNPFRLQISPPTNVTFDASKPSLLEVKKAKSGVLLVRPLVNGKDVDWFQLSSGVAGNVLHVRTAKKLGLETYGEWEGGGRWRVSESQLEQTENDFTGAIDYSGSARFQF